ncbi:ExeA family protein [Thermodesulfobacteriota bacterium B35]
MYLEHFRLNTSPFSEEPDPAVFFPGGGREEVLESLLRDIESGKPLIKLIGSEGSGKTLLCRMLMERLPEGYETICLDNPVGSFEALMRVVCLDLGMEAAAERSSADILEELRLLLELRAEQQHRVVLIIDEAEKLFLATLERVVRVICDTDEAGMLTILLAGRTGLDANLDQLSIYCSNVDINAGYRLEPLGRDETGDYLNFRLRAAGLTGEQQQDIFTPEAVDKIYRSARGNLRLTNILAEESLQHSCSDKSFLVLLDHVDTEPGQEEGGPRPQRSGLSSWLPANRKWLLAGGTLLVLLLAVLLLTGRHAPTPEQPPVQKEAEVTDHGVHPPPAVPGTGGGERSSTPPPPSSAPARQPSAPARSPAGDSTAGQAPPAAAPVTGPAVSTEESARKRDGDRLFRERLGASAKWLAGAYRGGSYTVQLMMLTSAEATANIKKMLTRDSYYGIRDKLYILRKQTSPPTLFVFYGIYDSMDAARRARNTMPLFLRKHHPYALSIADALKKTED